MVRSIKMKFTRKMKPRTFKFSYHGKIDQDEIYKEDEAENFYNLVKN